MAKTTGVVPISPTRLRCPFCAALPGKRCKTSGGHNLRNALGIRVALIHVARIKKAAGLDLAQSRHVRTPLTWTYERL